MIRLLATMLLLSQLLPAFGQPEAPRQTKPSYADYIRNHLPEKRELDVFLNELSWAQFDSEVGYVLGKFMPRDGIDGSATISTSKPDGARTSYAYRDKPCRINTYGNSFTLCHQVSDGETWQEYLAAHLGEPIRNFGMGGFGLYQSYRRMLSEEQTDNGAEYVMLYIWGDDHRRSLLRCRYMLISAWNRKQNAQEGMGRMFHGNFWSNIEMNLQTGKLEEHENRLATPKSLYRMLDADWMIENLKDDLALQMGLYLRGQIGAVDVERLQLLGKALDNELTMEKGRPTLSSVEALLDAYSFSATKHILLMARDFTDKHGKNLMIILLDPYRVTRVLLDGGDRYDQEIVSFLKKNDFRTFDMNVVHQEDFRSFNLDSRDYMRRYFIGHYSPAGNHFFAYNLKDKLVNWLSPRPLPYRDTEQQIIDFKGYLQGF